MNMAAYKGGAVDKASVTSKTETYWKNVLKMFCILLYV